MESVFTSVDGLINYPAEYIVRLDVIVFSHRRGYNVRWSSLAALEEKVLEWSKEHPVIWNVGIGPAASGSFVPTLTRLLFERTRDLYGPYDQITSVRLPPTEAASSSAAQHRLAFEVLTEILMRDDSKQLHQELKELAAEESYFGYGKISDNLMLQAFGQRYIYYFASDQSVWKDPIYGCHPDRSPILKRIREALEGKRHLLLVENLHVPVSLDGWFSYWASGGHPYSKTGGGSSQPLPRMSVKKAETLKVHVPWTFI